MAKYKKIIAENRKAYFDYYVLETIEAGIVLKGNEVKSIRIGRVNLKDSFAKIENGEMVLYNMHISPYSYARKENLDPLRNRKLLLKKSEIRRLAGKVSQKGFVLVPLKIYFSGNYAKIELALCKGKKLYDKRREIKKRDADREMERELIERER